MVSKPGPFEFPSGIVPENVLAMCRYFGVDLGSAQEYYLLPLVAEACMAALPDHYEEREDKDGNPLFVNHK